MSGDSVAASLALVDFGPCKESGQPADWVKVASPMCEYCDDGENVDFAAARILAGEVRFLRAALEILQKIKDS